MLLSHRAPEAEALRPEAELCNLGFRLAKNYSLQL
jgi:hypothetical protein